MGRLSTTECTYLPTSKPRSPHSATAAVRMDVCAPGSEPSPCRLRTSRRPDGLLCARQ